MTVFCQYIIFYYMYLTLPAVFTLGFLIESLYIIISSVRTSVVCCRCCSVGTVVAPGADAMSGAEATFLKIKYIIFICSTFVSLSVILKSSSVFLGDNTTNHICYI